MKTSLQLTVQSFSDADPEIRQQMDKPGSGYIIADGRVYFRAGSRIYSCKYDEESAEMIRDFASRAHSEDAALSENEAWKAVLDGREDGAILQKFGIRDGIKRSILVFRPSQPAENRFFRDSIPLDENDRLITFENGDVAVILNMDGRMNEEAEEYAAAVTQTMESEAGFSCTAGIGRISESFRNIAARYGEALSAIETGIRHRMQGRVFVYEKQTLERLADMIPEKKAEEVKTGFIPKETEKILTNETIETVRVFFRNDLNLSTTARELFIHRNTLLYRMEKIRKATGLDLRKFEDAAVFRFLMCISDDRDIYKGF